MDYSILQNGLKEVGLNMLSEFQLDQFDQYYRFLIEKNKVMNLTAITDPEEVQTKHFLDSLMCLKTGLLNKNIHVIDVGTGAGFPGIPLKIACPDIHLTLADSLNKRIRFLNEVIEMLQLENVEAVHGRAEDLGRNDKHREQYDVCVSRAVSNLNTLLEYCTPFVKVEGYFVAYKSGEINEELTKASSAMKKLGCILDKVEYFNIPGSNISRSFVIIRKVKHTLNTYPRKAGTPQKEPL